MMETSLIPQPHDLRTDGKPSTVEPKNRASFLSMPEHDDRLVSHGALLFGSAAQQPASHGFYALTTRQGAFDAALAERSRGRTDGYSLRISGNEAELYADTARGLFYAMKTVESLAELNNGTLPEAEIVDWADVPLRSDYFDLRTVFPTFNGLLQAVKRLSRWKLNALVVEYEDKLPFQEMAFLRHPEYCLSKQELLELQQTAYENFIDLIPLQQSFGHLEYVLKHPDYRYLRETPDMVGDMCPLRDGAFDLAAKLIRETAGLHPKAKYLHLGCDEVWSLGSSEECRASGKSREQIFIQFVNRLAEEVCSLGKTPMVWHDMLGRCGDEDLALLDKRIVVVVWIYNGNNLSYQVRAMVQKLRRQGIRAVGGSAVRSGDGNGEQNYPVADNRVGNLNVWSDLAVSEQLEGIIDTNWASPFSLGKPYGLYETSLYTIAYGAERSWNSAGGRDTFLDRFYSSFHGVPQSVLGAEGFRAEDYYCLMERMLPQVTRNQDTAMLIAAMLHYEHAVTMHFPAHTQIFRAELFPDREEEITSLRAKAAYTYEKLEENHTEMEQIVSKLLRPSMARLYLHSRFCLPELHRKEIERLLGTPVGGKLIKEN